MNRGFSLVELSIVLVILGLLTGGILAGQSLIRAAELRSVSTDVSRYTAAIYSFRDKYFGLPGDFNNATKFWGTAATGSDCMNIGGNGTETCDGNGNGRIGNSWNVCGVGVPEKNEGLRFWQHLANAGLVEGGYTGASVGPGLCDTQAGVNLPSSKVAPNASFEIASLSPAGSGANYYRQFIQNALRIRQPGALLPILRSEEAWNIEMKMDDGVPSTGKIESATNAFTPDCVNVSGTAYQLNNNVAAACILLFFTVD